MTKKTEHIRVQRVYICQHCVLAAVSGGFIAQAPNALLTQLIGWRGAAWTLAGFEAVFLTVEVVLWLAQILHEKKQRETQVMGALQN